MGLRAAAERTGRDGSPERAVGLPMGVSLPLGLSIENAIFPSPLPTYTRGGPRGFMFASVAESVPVANPRMSSK